MHEYTEISFSGIAIVGLLWIGVSDRYMLIPVTAFAVYLLLYFPALEFFTVENYLTETWMYVAVATSGGVGLFSCYYLRFRKIGKRQLIDYLKLSAVFLASAALPIAFLSNSDNLLAGCLLYVCLVYYYDRLVKPSPMQQRKQMVVISIMGVLCALMIIYALVQRTQAIRQREISIELERKAIEATKEAEKQAEIAKRALEECQKK